ncbi:MAG: TAT-variant-translocated molybdopterin oxidoreductase [Fimbriimonadaceae bacterium]|nr:TAT-variant-translocated molybdopterin oxidoreductase [Fimbriimonadaceae bacterium]
MNNTRGQFDLAAVREKLAGKSGRAYWRSLEEVAETPEFQAWVDDEFPNRNSLMQVDRRSLLKYMGASMMLAGLAGCRSLRLPPAKLVPYVNRPEEMVSGEKLYFATGYTLQGITDGIIVESNYGRPTKIEGNPKHPFSGGSSTSLMQASILDLYDPDRSKTPAKDNVPNDWVAFLGEARAWVADAAKKGGQGLAVLVPTVGSPSVMAELETIKRKYPNMVIASWEPAHRDRVYKGAAQSFGKPLETVYNLAQAKVVLSIASDFMSAGPGSLKYAREWAQSRNVDGDPAGMSRLYSVESTPTTTGAIADHRLALGAMGVRGFIQALAARIGVPAANASQVAGDAAVWLEAVAQDLEANNGASVVIPGEDLDADSISLCHSINQTLGANGKLVNHHSPVTWMAGGQEESLERLLASDISTLFILGGNPVFNAPASRKFGEFLKKAKHSVHLSPYLDETSRSSQWHLPESHALESWGDGQALDGTTTIIQPLIDPLYDTKSMLETLREVFGDGGDPGDNLKASWAKNGLSDKAWRSALNDGVVPNSKNPAAAVVAGMPGAQSPQDLGDGELEILFRADPTIFDGRFANNGWLQELPKPLTTMTWDNTVQVSPKLAEKLGIVSGDLVKVTTHVGDVTGGAWVLPGQAENTITIHYGYGQDWGDSLIAAGTGFNAYKIWNGSPVMMGSIAKSDGKIALASTQMHHYLEGRDIVREMELDALLHPHEGEHAEGEHHRDISMYPDPDKEFPYDGPKWGMTIDLNVCIGCHACVTACQAENNIAVVGKDQVLKGREMHWIRVDRYYGTKGIGEVSGKVKPTRADLDNPTTHLMPVTCMHCEAAPCEPVCPVAATVHSKEGLNQMVYNRCVGTRYCSNNCPYKVRRFNFLNYNDRKFSDFKIDGHNSSRDLRVRLMVNNPEVTVRGRGVMEKCTYCVQRINAARIHAKNAAAKGQREKPDPMDGEIVTACQQACPTGAIAFGNIADESSRISRLKKMPRNYSLLEELNTHNRTTYLTKLRNPNKEVEPA